MDKRFVLALKYYEAGLLAEAWASLDTLAAESDASLDALSLAAAVRLEMRAFDEVVVLSLRILAADTTNLAAWLYKAQGLFQMGREADGETAMTAAATLPGSHPAGWNNLGNILDDLGRPDQAQAALLRAIEQAPAFSLAHNNLGTVLAGQGRYAAAAAAHRQALACDPGNLAARSNLGVALLEQGLADEAVTAFDTVLAIDPSRADAADNRLYAAIYGEPDPRATHAAHAAWGKSMPGIPSLRPADPNPSRRLRVGYVSPDFRQHSVSFFFEPWLSAHNAAEVEVFCYADVIRGDAVTAQLRAAAHTWRDVYGMSDEKLFHLIREDRIDILVDLAGHTKGNRLGVFARRAAPVQVTALGYPATTGLPAIDYRFCDAVTDPPPEADAFAVETLVRLTPGLHCYAPPRDAPAVAPLPALAAGHITFGAFNKLAKISPATVALWAGVLKAMPESRLVIKTKPLAEEATRARLEGALTAQGIDPQRLDLRGWLPGDRAHLELYNHIDIALDTVPYNGTTTTCEALWMGVPVLTLLGCSHAARVGASLLSQIGKNEWAAVSPADFTAKALALADDVSALVRLRQGLRAHVAASPLCDAQTHARALEAAYRAMWRKACASAFSGEAGTGSQ